MKATGIVRRIDDLGRVVIPKEIGRATLWRFTPAGTGRLSLKNILSWGAWRTLPDNCVRR